MKLFAALAAAAVFSPVEGGAQPRRPSVAPPQVHDVAPALAQYTDVVLFGDMWEREALSKRDRSLVTVSALVAGGHVDQMRSHMGRALDNGVTPVELSGVITHLAFYAGWPRAMSAVGVANGLLTDRGLTPISPGTEKLPFDPQADAPRAASVQASTGPVAPGLAAYTNEILFEDLWLRTDLTPRDRSVVTLVALIVNGQAEQLPFHLDRALDNGVTRSEVGEMITHLAFYAGWPRAISAVNAVSAVYDTRPE
ncbi:carboxymuconolactone decarboxylase family protein [Brevundimonas albigilva]|uniref:carboxymuconolactone decarboxylase family protein n=1 Tax=Brevundimonas albigilva TaxID=1312364 RepID=UPI00201B497E|nr:carboxymuconolactone decarboxylase family protein [Brevundimonas albigilva]UQV18141.1 carboxymuconolactone decarboxylase family protein [Brevundimonas albigilva]